MMLNEPKTIQDWKPKYISQKDWDKWIKNGWIGLQKMVPPEPIIYKIRLVK